MKLHKKYEVSSLIEKYVCQMFSMKCYTELARILKKTDIPYAIIKGEILSLMAYGNEGMRNSSDIDILLPRKDLHKFELLLKNEGFRSKTDNKELRTTMLLTSHQIAPMEKRTYDFAPMIIDLNFDIFWGEYEGRRVDISAFLQDAIKMDVYGVQLSTLSLPKSFVQVILHHYKELNSIYLLLEKNYINKQLFNDVYYMLKRNKENLPIKVLYELSSELDIIPYMFYVLYFTYKIFSDQMMREYVEAFRCKEGERLLSCYGLTDKERKEWKYDFETRLLSKNIYSLIENDLTMKDEQKISFNYNFLKKMV